LVVWVGLLVFIVGCFLFIFLDCFALEGAQFVLTHEVFLRTEGLNQAVRVAQFFWKVLIKMTISSKILKHFLSALIIDISIIPFLLRALRLPRSHGTFQIEGTVSVPK